MKALARKTWRSGLRAWTRVAASLVLTLGVVFGAEVIPPAPPNHFNDFAGVVRNDTAARLNAELAQFERDTSNQILVAIYPRMPSDSSVEDYAVRVAQRWGVGQRDKRNGAVLFMFQESRDIRIVTGYGLEGALPDALCKRIIETELIPRFRAGDFDGGLTAGVRAMIAAVRGEYRGTGQLVAERSGGGGPSALGTMLLIPLLLAVVFISLLRQRSRRPVLYGPRGRRTPWTDNSPWWGGPWSGGGGPWGGGGGWGGGGSSGGTFSGGGGSFGGGGAGGKW